MDILSIIIIAIGLAMDCFAVSISKGMHAKKHHFWMTFRMAMLFGIFQAVMPLLGYAASEGFAEYMKQIDHWLAFGLLTLIGGKMVIEGLKTVDPDEGKTVNPFKWSIILPLALATSIDAFATGIVFVTFPGLIWKAITIIGITSIAFTFLGVYIGVHFGKRFNVKVEMIGGFILIIMGLKILIEHFTS